MSNENNSIEKVVRDVVDKIEACENILVAMNQNPTVDEICSAIGLTMILNHQGKHVTAIYSGKTPNTLEFLKPNETFEKDTNSLQDFIIALSKDKADHLRYEVKDDFVKVYITPYRSKITEKDLEFSKGDFNVDLVISIDVSTSETLDAALREHGRIMHDATSINITTNQAGRFADLEWSDPSKSSVCEMIVNLLEYLGVSEIDQPTATALLTGIVSETDRFSNARTTFETMQVASKLMQAGADQLLISSNINAPEKNTPSEDEVAETEEPENSDSLEDSNAEFVSEEPVRPEPQPATYSEPLIPSPSLVSQPAEQYEPVAATAPIAPANVFEPTMNPAAQNAPSIPMDSFDATSMPNMPYETVEIPRQEMAETNVPAAPAPEMSQAPVPPDWLQQFTAPNASTAPTAPVEPMPEMAPVEPMPVEPAMPTQSEQQFTQPQPIQPQPIQSQPVQPQAYGGIELPPPPAPDVNMGAVMPPAIAVSPEPVVPQMSVAENPVTPAAPAAAPTQSYDPLSDPSAFHIPNA